ncbi:hypothetical protein FHU34_113823 [Micromonospora taraxaci]|uniref:Nucleoside 2-deoxyribosyltransferase-like protein n=1 Tax=Micromonospora taraxaci TaxID=1316803 RepID=A0A561W3Q8_9ACTN|nr:hypothetical protein FHU34_113823 [Micromonospora taraxaci]
MGDGRPIGEAAQATSKDAPVEQTGAKAAPKRAAAPKKATAKKTTAKKVTAKKVTAKKTMAKKTTAKKGAPTAGVAGKFVPPAKFPRHAVERALRIPRAIYEQNGGRPATPREAVAFAGGTSLTGAYELEISSSKKYGFLESESGRLALTDRARKAIAPQSENDRLGALRDAVLAAPDISTVYNYYRGENLPDRPFLVNALVDRFNIPSDKVTEFLEIFEESIKSAKLIDETGERPKLIDAGRDDAHKPPAGVAAPRAAVAAGTTCFVMQPFSGALGGYYESIYKPAIEQAGLTAIRADDDIFATGKVIDQIWRGIRGARVLVAELTTKNPNVFYELGLAHALQKPVILISSNQDDVPFDLRHIRVILYDQTDPWWGAKLVDKVADNIRSAISDPEDEIFRLDRGISRSEY